ncbi:MAG: hypothetical protein U0931_06120 [Vulcanimicrobiota bacterium]
MGSYLAALTVFAVFILTMVTMAVQHFHFSGMAYQQQAAKNLAEAAIQQALIKIVESDNQSWGTRRTVAEEIVVNNSLYPQGSRGIVLFNQLRASQQKLPFSTNNFNGTGEQLGDLKRSVPLNTFHLVGTGFCGEAQKTVEALYYVPPFPSALASEGPVRSSGPLLVAGVKDPGRFPGHYEDLPPDLRAPSHVFSNSRDARAVILEAGAIVKGNVGAVGGIDADQAKIEGERRPHSDPQPLPRIDMDVLFARLDQQIGKETLSGSIGGDYSLEWNAQCNGDLHITGSLKLNQGVLFVKGNLEVDGGITGEGVIYVGGRTTVHRGANLTSSDQVALMSKGKILLDGAGRNDYFFQGMLYCEEEIQAREITVLGACIARGLGGLTFENANVLNSPVTVSLIEGLEVPNQSDDDTVQIILRVEERDPRTRQPLTYKIQLRGRSDDVGQNDGPTTLSPAQEGHGLHNFEEIKNWIQHTNPSTYAQWTKDAFSMAWWWEGGPNSPLQQYMDMLAGRLPDPDHRFGLNLNPNEVVGILDRSRVLLWQDVANPYAVR